MAATAKLVGYIGQPPPKKRGWWDKYGGVIVVLGMASVCGLMGSLLMWLLIR